MAAHPWFILAQGPRLRWGGDLRRHHIFAGLARQTGASVLDGWSALIIRRGLPPARPWRRAWVAAAEFLPDEGLDIVRDRGEAIVLDVHDLPVVQMRALGLDTDPAVSSALAHRSDRNLEQFRWLVAQSPTFADLAGFEPERVIIAPNGAATNTVVVRPWPDTPIVGMVSGAAPGRGIETLIDAMPAVRAGWPDARLQLWLVATGEASRAYRDQLEIDLAGNSFVEIGAVPYERLSDALGASTVLVVPHPPTAYWDAILPVKLFDCMAAGRPVVVTPRTETAALVARHEAGRVAADGSEGLATAIVNLLDDAPLARRLGANARAAAEREYDWRVISDRLGRDILART